MTHFWTAEHIPAEDIDLPISTNGLIPCAVAPIDRPTEQHIIPFRNTILPDGRRAIPFLHYWEAQATAADMNPGQQLHRNPGGTHTLENP